VVVKARRLSGSRGVIRADDSEELVRAVNRVRAIQCRADRDAQELGLIIEDFIPGREYALEGTLERGELTTLALFDKPDPLDGPYFEETLYVTPPGCTRALRTASIRRWLRAAAWPRSLGRPAEVRSMTRVSGFWRWQPAVGGLMRRVLPIPAELEELIHPWRWRTARQRSEGRRGRHDDPYSTAWHLPWIKGPAAAQSVPAVTGVTLTVEPGQIIAPPPDGASYLGFIFARAASPEDAETALRIAHRRLHFDIRPEYPAMEAPTAERP
jgi:hypothetical protein